MFSARLLTAQTGYEESFFCGKGTMVKQERKSLCGVTGFEPLTLANWSALSFPCAPLARPASTRTNERTTPGAWHGTAHLAG